MRYRSHRARLLRAKRQASRPSRPIWRAASRRDVRAKGRFSVSQAAVFSTKRRPPCLPKFSVSRYQKEHLGDRRPSTAAEYARLIAVEILLALGAMKVGAIEFESFGDFRGIPREHA